MQTTDNQTAIMISVADTAQQRINEVELLYHDGKIGKILKPNEDGLFAIDADSGIIIAKGVGYQFGGMVIDESVRKIPQGGESLTLTLTLRRTDQTAVIKRTLPFPLDQKQRTSLRDEMSDQMFAQLDQAGDMMTQGRLLPHLGRHQPQRVLDYLEQNRSLLKPIAVSAKQEVIAALAQTEPERAIELVAGIDDPTFQAISFAKLMQSLPADSPLRAGLEDQWLRAVERISQPQLKFAATAMIVAYFQSTDRSEKATQMIVAQLKQVEQLPSAGWAVYPRSLFAALIVTEDPERAERIVDAAKPASDSEKRELIRAWSRLAFHSCTDVDLTKRFLAKIDSLDNSRQQFGYRVKVLQKFAAHHPQEAIELAGNIGDANWRAWTMGIIAGRISESNPELARQTLANAVQAAFEGVDEADDPHSMTHSGSILGGLLPVAEKVAPDQVESMLWQAAWLTIPRSQFSDAAAKQSAMLQKVAAAISRYDRELGQALFGNREFFGGFTIDGGVTSVIVLRPEITHEYLELLASKNPFDQMKAKGTLLALLSSEEGTVWNQVSLPLGLQWQSDVFEDN